MSKRIKTVDSINSGERIKNEHTPEHEEFYDEHPFFSFFYLHQDYCIDSLRDNQKVHFADRLHRMSQMTWRDFLFGFKEKNGSELISPKEISRSIPSKFTQDVKLLVFRLKSGNSVLIGVREKQVLHILFLDPNGELYNHD